jgi:thiol-disulfide isomerase/thioredoxin
MKSNKKFSLLMACLCLLLLVLLIYPTYSSEKKQTNSVTAANSSAEVVKGSKTDETKDHRIIVYYLRRTSRCATCKKIEKYTLEAVNDAFEKELSAGTIQIKVLNVDEKQYNHFIKDYNLITKSVIVSDMAGSSEKRWKNLEKIWEYVINEEKFKEYIIEEVKAYL